MTYFWIPIIILLYCSLWFSLVSAQGAWITNKRVLLAAFIIPFSVLAVPFVSPIFTVGAFAASLLFISIIILIFSGFFHGSDSKERMNLLLKARRSAGLHLILTTGAILFLIPFAWLIVTSFKEDIDMGKFPPLWIPKRQVTMNIGGKDLPLVKVNLNGKSEQAVVIEELQSGDRKIKILQNYPDANQELSLPHEKVKPIRKPGLRWENYTEALNFLPPDTYHGLLYVGNTLWLVIMNVIGTLLASSMVAYGFARLRFPGRDQLFFVLIATMMLPGAVTMLPVFLIFRSLGWVDTLKPLWVPAFFGSAFNIFLLRQFFMTIPKELEEAARIDGSSYFGTYWRIMLPQIKPALAAVTILTFMGSWNSFIGPLIYINSPEKMPVAYALQLFQQSHSGEPGMLMAASTLVMLPVIIVFFFSQRYFIQGITLTGIKG